MCVSLCGQASGDGRPSDGDGPNVLHVMIDNMIYPVTLDVLHTVSASTTSTKMAVCILWQQSSHEPML